MQTRQLHLFLVLVVGLPLKLHSSQGLFFPKTAILMLRERFLVAENTCENFFPRFARTDRRFAPLRYESAVPLLLCRCRPCMVADRGNPKRAPDARYPMHVGQYPMHVGQYPNLVGKYPNLVAGTRTMSASTRTMSASKVGRGNSGHGIVRGNSGHFNVATGKKHPFYSCF